MSVQKVGCSRGQQKKVNRKLAKFQHVIKKEAGVNSSPIPTNNLAICNAGLVNGLTEESIFEYFSEFGPLSDILLLPGKSCSFLAYEDVKCAVAAYNALNGKLDIAQYNRPIYLLYVDQLPRLSETTIWDKLPPGLIIINDFISTAEEESLLKLCSFRDQLCGIMKNRLVEHFGFEFRYDINNVDKDKPLSCNVPCETNFLWARLQQTHPEFGQFQPDQLTVNCYSPGQGIPHHVDTHSAFESPIMCLSLASTIVMEFKNEGLHICSLLPRRSLLIMSGESRYNWTHGIVPRKFDVIRNKSAVGFTCLKRETRISFTFRKVLHGDCKCSFKAKCDQMKQNNINGNVAAQLEALHVHEVYENIADHFSDTRHKPWPNVLEFVQSFTYGDILVDVGCGNGKYLGHNKYIFDIGCDRSTGLVDICRGKKVETFITDCLSIPINDQYVDGVISIAVIHHLATEERRLKAIKEMVRILRIGGKGLIYVWAHEQIKNQKKSSYIMQCRKNRKETTLKHLDSSEGRQEVPLPGGIELPVHANRSNFKASDVLVPWKLKDDNKTFLRFYHVFGEHELEKMCQQINNIEIIRSYYDQGNWCISFRRVE
ncbi:hypothetical protein HUJ04_006921 [Dendroctonus ponderosae]|uniref:tRNA (carboxymethyluridine(34)-5-O)-methyltransferase n=2 Tax=Dendroctonus ponderosae TaxID=77166 RepID=A0AAR5Q1K8_DENPD|nr:hypothetical protein HUJ04_006921 [Dendroctonus ponderosae]